MNPAYRHARFRAELPHGGLPESFAVITACNPEGKSIATEGNARRSEEFRQRLLQIGHDHFPVTGYDAHSAHEEAGVGIVCDDATACRIGDELRQEAIFRVTRGEVSLIHLRSGDTPVPAAQWRQGSRDSLNAWSSMADGPAAHPSFHFRGSMALLDAPATAFLCSTKCPAEKVEEAYEWARKQCDLGSTIISGFHTPVEKDVLAILARRGARIIWVTARELPKTNQKEFRPTVEQGRLLIISPFDYGTRSRSTKDSCSERNRFVVNYATEQYVPYLSPDSAINVDLQGL